MTIQTDTGVTAVAHVIQLAVAPVFLVTGIGAMLGVMTSRLARVVDRARALEAAPSHAGPVAEELLTLGRRAELIGRSIILCTATALLVSGVIAVLFIGAFIKVETSKSVALLLITAMIAAFVLGLVMFLREILIATRALQIGIRSQPPN